MADKWAQLVVADHYLGYLFLNPLHMWCIHFVGESSEVIRFLAMLVKCPPSGGQQLGRLVVSNISTPSRLICLIFARFVVTMSWKSLTDCDCNRVQGASMAAIFVAASFVGFWRFSGDSANRHLDIIVVSWVYYMESWTCHAISFHRMLRLH